MTSHYPITSPRNKTARSSTGQRSSLLHTTRRVPYTSFFPLSLYILSLSPVVYFTLNSSNSARHTFSADHPVGLPEYVRTHRVFSALSGRRQNLLSHRSVLWMASTRYYRGSDPSVHFPCHDASICKICILAVCGLQCPESKEKVG